MWCTSRALLYCFRKSIQLFTTKMTKTPCRNQFLLPDSHQLKVNRNGFSNPSHWGLLQKCRNLEDNQTTSFLHSTLLIIHESKKKAIIPSCRFIKCYTHPISSFWCTITLQNAHPLDSSSSSTGRNFASITHMNAFHSGGWVFRLCPMRFADALLLCLQLESAVGIGPLVVILIAHHIFLGFRFIVKPSVLC